VGVGVGPEGERGEWEGVVGYKRVTTTYCPAAGPKSGSHFSTKELAALTAFAVNYNVEPDYIWTAKETE